MRLFINSLAASAGGGLTYIRNVLPHLAARPGLDITVALGSGLAAELSGLARVDVLEVSVPPARRFVYEHAVLPNVIRQHRADVLLSTGNFALRNSPVPQILLSRNSLYTSKDFYHDLLWRHEYKAWLDTRLRALIARRSVHWADVTVAPSEAFADELRRWTGVQVLAIHHGFDHESFVGDVRPLPPDIAGKLHDLEGSLKLLFVSHYNYYRNFETLLRALPLLRDGVSGRDVKLLLTCSLHGGKNPGAYRPERAADLAGKLGVSDMIVELGTVPYGQLHKLYAQADIYVTAAYAETFAHPLVEAMASGLPVVASNLAVHQEICGDAAIYFPRFSAEALAERVAQIARSAEMSKQMAARGLDRSREFSWRTHVDRILDLSSALIDSRALRSPNQPVEEMASKRS